VNDQLAGVLPVISTPFRDDDTIDQLSLEREIDWLIDCEVDGLTIAMVSEVLKLGDAERRELTDMVVALAAGRCPVIASVGAESTRVAVTHARAAESAGVAAVMAIPPMAVALPDHEIERYYRAILDSVGVPVVVQDASGYVGRALPISLYMSLLESYGPERVLFKPEAVPIGPRLSELHSVSDGRARVFEGTGGLSLVDSYQRGIVGTMPGAEIPWAIVALWRALSSNDWPMINRIQGPLSALISIQTSLDSFIAVEKHLLVRQGVFESTHRRGPLGYELDQQTTAEVDRLVDLLRGA